jgi:hypothetical protein
MALRDLDTVALLLGTPDLTMARFERCAVLLWLLAEGEKQPVVVESRCLRVGEVR